MKPRTTEHLNALESRVAALSALRHAMRTTVDALVCCYRNNGTVLVCGNGGSAADSEHIVGELMKGFVLKRPMSAESTRRFREHGGSDAELLAGKLQCGIPAISLVSHVSLTTAINNDIGADMAFAQQVFALGKTGDVLMGLSTSGNARNVCLALQTARASGITTIGLTGADGGAMNQWCDILIAVPATGSHLVQELHLPVYHTLCLMVESELFEE